MRKAGESMRQRYENTHRVSFGENKIHIHTRTHKEHKKGVQEDEKRLIKRQEKE